MNDRVLEGLLLGAVQGITEWLPISSEGVITLIQLQLFGRSAAESISYALWLHVGTLLASVVYFRREVLHLFKCLPRWLSQRESLEPRDHKFIDFLLLSTLVTGLVGAPLLLISLQVGIYTTVATALIGLLLIATGLLQLHAPRFGQRTITHLNWRDAGLLGIVQGLSVLPGISRSGFTISALLMRGYQEAEALKISFIMSIPVVLGAQILLELGGALTFDGSAALAGVVASAIVGWLMLDALMRLARRLPFWAFAIGLGLLSLVAALIQ